MEDSDIIELYWKREEEAIKASDAKYGHYCHTIAFNILFNNEDSAECVNDTYLKAWQNIPPERPLKLGAYLGKICRNIALHLYEKMNSLKRGGSETDLCLDELSEIISDNNRNTEEIVNAELLKDSINAFLYKLKEKDRRIFIARYWYMCSLKNIAKQYHLSLSAVKMSLSRTREKLKDYLLQEGYTL